MSLNNGRRNTRKPKRDPVGDLLFGKPKRQSGYTSFNKHAYSKKQIEKFSSANIGWGTPFDGKYDPKMGLKIVVVLALVFSGWVAGDYGLGGPLTHSYQEIFPTTSSHDPTTQITKYSAPNSNLNEFNLVGNAQYKSSGCQFFPGTLQNCMLMQSSAQTGNITLAASDQSIGSQGLDSQHPAFYEQGNWFLFYAGGCAGSACLNYTSATTPEGPWTEHSTGRNPFALIESTSFACDANSTVVVCAVGLHAGNNLYVDYGTISGGTISFKSWQTIVQVNQVNTPEVVYEHTEQNFYISFNVANSACGTNADSCSYYIVNSDSSLTNWSSNVFLGQNNPTTASGGECPGDMVQTGVDMGNGSVYFSYFAYFIANSCSGTGHSAPQPASGFFGRVVDETTPNGQESIPCTTGYYCGGITNTRSGCAIFFTNPCALGLQDFLFTTSPGVITGIFQYGIYDATSPKNSNTTYEMTPFFATRSASGWSTPARSTSDTGQYLLTTDNSHWTSQMELLSFSYDNNTKNYSGEHVCGAQLGNTCVGQYVTIFSSTFTVVNPVDSYQVVNSAGQTFNQFGGGPRYYPASTNQPFFTWDGTSPTGNIRAISFSMTDPVYGARYTLAESQNLIGDLSTLAGKEFEMGLYWTPASNALTTTNPSGGFEASWSFFLTTNSTLWKTSQQLWTPYNDPSVPLMITTWKSGTDKFSSTVYIQQHSGDTLRSEDTFSCSGSGYLCMPSVLMDYAGQAVGKYGALDWLNLNFTGSSNAAQVGAGTACNIIGGPDGHVPNPVTSSNAAGCSYFQQSDFGGSTGDQFNTTSTVKTPAFQFSGQSYYAGLWLSAAEVGSGMNYCFNAGSVCGVATVPVTNGCTTASMEIDYCVPNPQSNQSGPSATPDSGGFFGSIWRGLTTIGSQVLAFTQPIWGPATNFLGGIGNSLLSGVLGGLQSFISFLSTYFPAAIAFVLNGIGQFFGWGPIGTEFVSFVSGVIQFLTVGLVTSLGWLLQLILRSLDVITILNIWFSFYITGLLNLLANLIALIGFIVTLGKNFVVIYGTSYVLLETLFFLWYSCDEGLSGWHQWFETSKWLAFISYDVFERMINFGISSITWIMGRIPTFDGTVLPNLPTINISGGPSWPSARMDAIREGDMGGYIGVFLSSVALIFELGNGLLPGVPSNPGLNAMTPILYVFVTLAGIMFLVMIPMQLFSRVFGIGGSGMPELAAKVPLGVSRGRGGPTASISGGFRRRDGRFGQKFQFRPRKLENELARLQRLTGPQRALADERIRQRELNRTEMSKREMENEKKFRGPDL